jgi:hypothetical protein
MSFIKNTILLFMLMASVDCLGQINIPLLHQLVEDSKTEHKIQLEAKEKQSENAIHEEVNRNILDQVKTKYSTLQQRFAKLTILLDAAGIAVTASPLVKSIVDNQQQIVFYCQKDPLLIPFAMEAEKVFVKQSYSLMNYLIGLSASIDDLNQMKVSDRRMLFQHIINELRQINHLSIGSARALQSHIQRRRGGNPYLEYVNREMYVVDEIMDNIKTLEN